MDEMSIIVEVSRVVTDSVGDRYPWQFHQFQVGLLALREKVTTIQEAILHQNEELEGMRLVFVKSSAKLTCVGEQLDSLMVPLEFTLEHQSSPLQTYIDGACSVSSLPLHIGEKEAEPLQHILCVDQSDEMRRHERCRVQCLPDGGLVLCMRVYTFNPSLGAGW